MCTPPARVNPVPSLLRTAEEISQMRHAELKCQLAQATCELLAQKHPLEWWSECALERLRQQKAAFQPVELSEADQQRLAAIRAREAEFKARYHRRQALKPAALLSRLKARLARVSWDSWG